MRTLLTGNGLNIQFGGRAYTSQFIVARMKCNARIQKYDVLFEGTITGANLADLFDGFVDFFKRIMAGECDKLIRDKDDEDLEAALDDFKIRYANTIVSEPQDILLEDWLFVLRMYNELYHVDEEGIAATKDAFVRLFLDAIYNDGKIQTLYQNINKRVRRFLKGFDELYTVNYDANLENATERTVFHLHGDFNEMQASENPGYVMGYLKVKAGESIVVPGFEHCFCNALLDYSGDKKYDTAKIMHLANKEADSATIEEIIQSDASEPLKKVMLLHKAYPELKIAPEYHFEDFEKISGELVVIGLSPNNDQHIIKMILSNKNITNVKFYVYTEAEKGSVNKLNDSRLEALNVSELWGSLGVETKNKTYFNELPSHMDHIINFICTMSEYSATEEMIRDDIKMIPPFKIKQLCDEAYIELKKHDAITSHPTEMDDMKRNFAYISHVALAEGILPATLLTLLSMHWKEYINVG